MVGERRGMIIEEQMCFQMKISVWAVAIREHLVYVWG